MTPAEALSAAAERAKCRQHVPDYADVLAEEVRRLRGIIEQAAAGIEMLRPDCPCDWSNPITKGE